MPQEDNKELSPSNGPNQKKPRNNVVIFVFGIIIIIALVAAAYYAVSLQGKNKAGKPEQPAGQGSDSGTGGTLLFGLSLTKPVFAEYAETMETTVPNIPGEAVNLAEIENLKSFADKEGINFSAAQSSALEQAGFFLTKNNIISDQAGWENKDDFLDTYKKIKGNNTPELREPQNTLFITSDLALHLYHLLVDRSFQRIEETKFQPMLRAMTAALYADSIKNYNSAADAKLKETYKRLSAYYLVPLVVLDAGTKSAGVNINPSDYENFAQYMEAVSASQIANSGQKLEFSLDGKTYNGTELPAEIYDLAAAELTLINGAKGIAGSPLFTPQRPEFKNDYSQFVPRSHYTKNDVLKSYFIAMMWYGRMGFALNSPEQTRDALVITGQINNLAAGTEKISKIWSDLAVAIDFFVGETDDLTAFQYTAEAEKVFGNGLTDKNLTDSQIQQFIDAAKKDLPKPRILSEAIQMNSVDEKTKEELLADTMQFRFMGQRFTIDAYILNKLTQGDESPDPVTGQKLPTMPTALMPISLLNPNNALAKGYLDAWVNDPARIAAQNRASDKVIANTYQQLDAELKAYSASAWTQNIYWSWLNCFRPLLATYGQGYPFFMMNEAWQKKNLGTVLGSYTELKHDTLLYAKQSYAEMGGGGPELPKLPPAVKGYVEPDLVFWNRIIDLANKTKIGLDSRGLMPEEFKDRYGAFIEQAGFYKKIVEAELKNAEISDDDFEKLRTSSDKLAAIAEPLPGMELTDKEKRAGIIADIHTDAVHSEILYEATGKPYIIYVAVKDKNGTRLTRGAVYSHYEFSNKIDGRLTDELWQERVYGDEGILPAADKWSTELVR